MMEQFLKITLDAIVDHVVVLETNGIILYANQAWKNFARKNGAPPGIDYVNTNYLDVCGTPVGEDSEDVLAVAQSIRSIISGDLNHFYIEYPCHSLTEKRWFGMRVTPLTEDAPRRVVIVHINITERVLAEQEVQTKHSQITSILNSVQDAIWSYTLPDKHIIYASPSFETLYGCSAQDFHQTYYKEIIDPDSLPAYEKALDQLAKRSFVDIKYLIIHPDGTKRWIHQKMVISYNLHDLSVSQIDGISRDITGLKLIEEKSRQLRLQQERIQMLQNFVSDVSHDFRTPMSIINTNIYLLSQTNSPESRRKRLRVMENQILRLDKLLDQMILLSKLDAANNELYEFDTMSLNSILQRLYHKCCDQAEQKGLELDFTESSDSIQVYGKEDYLFDAIYNILQNAIQHTLNGGIYLNIELTEHDVFIRIKDTGIGIPSNDLPYIFDRFFRVDKARSTETGGAGLGLSIAKMIVNIHSGTIQVTSTLGEGTLVTINLPTIKSGMMLPENSII